MSFTFKVRKEFKPAVRRVFHRCRHGLCLTACGEMVVFETDASKEVVKYLLGRAYCEYAESRDGIPRITEEESEDTAFMADICDLTGKSGFVKAGRLEEILTEMCER